MSTLGRALGLGLALVLVSSGVALAEDAEDDGEGFARAGSYLMVAGAFLLDQSESGSKLRIDTGNGGGLEAVAGYRWTRRVAFEIQGEFIRQDTDSSTSSWFLPSAGVRLKYFILTRRLQPFVSIGMGLLRAEERLADKDQWGWGGLARFGTGLDFYVTDHIVVDGTFEYLHGTGSFHGLRDLRFAVGPQYRF